MNDHAGSGFRGADRPRAPRRLAFLTRVFAALFVAILGAAPGCGYRLAGLGAGLPGHVEIVAVLPFENESAFPELEDLLTEELLSGFNRRGDYTVQEDEVGAHAVMEGVILRVEFAPAQLDPTSGQAATYLLIVEATVRLMDVVNDEPIFESDEFILRDEFAISEDPDASLDREGLAFQRIASAFADSLLVAILEGF